MKHPRRKRQRQAASPCEEMFQVLSPVCVFVSMCVNVCVCVCVCVCLCVCEA